MKNLTLGGKMGMPKRMTPEEREGMRQVIAKFNAIYEEEVGGKYTNPVSDTGIALGMIRLYTPAQREALIEGYFAYRKELYPDYGHSLGHLWGTHAKNVEMLKGILIKKGEWEEK